MAVNWCPPVCGWLGYRGKGLRVAGFGNEIQLVSRPRTAHTIANIGEADDPVLEMDMQQGLPKSVIVCP